MLLTNKERREEMERWHVDISALAGWVGNGVDRFPSPTQAIVLTDITGGDYPQH